MPFDKISHVVANSLIIVASLLSPTAVKITKLSVPELFQSNSSALILDCEYTAVDDRFVLQWLFNKQKLPVYEWRPRTEPVIRDALHGRLDEDYKVSNNPLFERRALRIVEPEPALSGEYTCVIKPDDGAGDQQTKTLIIYNPEFEFVLKTTIEDEQHIEVNCIARGLYPQPIMTLELANIPLRRQEVRVWRNESVYDACATGRLALSDVSHRERLTCRLALPQVGYTAIRGDTIDLNSIKTQLLQRQCRDINNSTVKTAERACDNDNKNSTAHHNCSFVIFFCVILFNSLSDK